MLDLKKHISLNCNKDIREICQPWFDSYQLNHLNYIRVYKDNTVFYLCNNHEWLKRYLQKGYPSIGAFEQKPELRNFQYVLWTGLDKEDQIIKDTREIFNIYYGITLIEKNRDYWEFYNIGTGNKNPNALNFFINNYDVLKKFTADFKEKSHKLMRISHADRLIIPRINSYVQKKHVVNSSPQKSLANMYTNNLFNTREDVSLTKAETLCIRLYLSGKSSIDIGQVLCISPRTVEKHIENVKRKFHCRKLFQLGYMVAKADIL